MSSMSNHQISNHISNDKKKEDNDETCVYVMQYANSGMVSMALNTAFELDIFGIIDRAGPGAQISASEIASKLPITKTPNPSPDPNPNDIAYKLDRMLTLFVSHSFLTCSLSTKEDGSIERVFGLAPASKFLLGGNGSEDSIAPLIGLSSHRAIVELWLRMKEAIVEEGGGDQFNRVHGMSVFQYMNKDPTFNRAFNQGLAGISTLVMRKILETYKGFEGITTLTDVGGGTGRTLNMIISKYPSIKGTNFDLPHVIQSAPPYPGVEHVGGDMFISIPKADAILIKDTLHNWSDEHCIEILKNCYKVLPENGKVIIICMARPEVPDTSLSSRYLLGLDFLMLMVVEGKGRTHKEYETLCKLSGFSKFSLACSAFDIWSVIEFCK